MLNFIDDLKDAYKSGLFTGGTKTKAFMDKYNLKHYIEDITYDKPNARYYIDDKGIRFNSWDDTLRIINILELKRMKLDA